MSPTVERMCSQIVLDCGFLGVHGAGAIPKAAKVL
jgi:hypothetical protein